MRKWLGYFFIIVGGLLVVSSLYLIYKHEFAIAQSLQEVESSLFPSTSMSEATYLRNTDKTKNDESQKIQHQAELRRQFSPEEGDAIGLLHIPKIKAKLPIIEGTDEEMLAKGVGHYSTTVFPGDGEQILLSGHRDTVFRKIGELENGDRFIVELSYGKFEYEIKKSEIVKADDTTVIRSMGEEVLTLSTCYPFNFIGHAPDRYIIYAYPVFSET
ncbi:class D sortase [Paenibacillus sp. FSL W8-0186]|uniref:Class D sortase n=1 Tax=Paenibacillus woosongensis TaxID=307580 RepID=A0ABQ4MKR1_9BACL|nr:class D sortase [Paenibacillus woosongensis]GIP56572.1 hypothetical protein J15TS10_03860 [Paenibacillus woosongensis]